MSRGITSRPDVTDGAEARPPTPADAPGPWYAIWVLSNAEFVVERALHAEGIASFLPAFEELTQWSDRKKMIRRPLFPGYLFGRWADRRSDVLRIAGVMDILPTASQPMAIPDAEINQVRQILASGLPFAACDYIQGDKVSIESGPLAGIRGVVQRTKNGVRVVVKVELLRRAVSVELDAADLAKAP